MPKMREVKTPLKRFGIRYYKDEDGIYYKKVGRRHRKPVKPFWKKKRITLGIPLVCLLVIGVVGYQVVMNIASEKVVNEISGQIPEKDFQELLKDPSIQKIVEEQLGAEKKEEILTKYAVNVPATTTGNEISASNTQGTGGASRSDASANKQETSEKSAVPKPVPESPGNSAAPKPAVNENNGKLQFTSRSEVMKFLLTKFTMGELTAMAKKADNGLTSEEKAEIKEKVLQKLSQEEFDALKVFAIIELSKGNI